MTDHEPGRLSGLGAAQRLLAEVSREEFVPLDLVARVLRASRRRVLRDWTRRGFPVTTVGHRKLLASTLVRVTYLPHACFPVKLNPIEPKRHT